MKIVFLGSSHGVPEPNRKCSCTMIEVQGRYYLFDMGTMPIEQLVTRDIPIDAVEGIFVTHMHGDHINGLIGFADLINWYFKTSDPIICLPRIEAADVIDDWIRLMGLGERKLRYQEILQGLIYEDEVLKVTAIPTQHIEKSYAFLVECEGKSILFSGDIKRPTIDFPKVIKEREIDLVICEAAHFPATEYAPIIKGCKIGKICVNHHAPWNIGNIQKLDEELDEMTVCMANDGMEICL